MATRRGFEPLLSALTGRRVEPSYTTGPFWDKNQFPHAGILKERDALVQEAAFLDPLL